MDMHNKEFDKLFSSKFEDFEVEPSNMVWQNLNEELGAGKRKKLLPLLGIAASIIVLIAAGMLFIKQKVNVVKPVKQQITRVKKPDFSTKAQLANKQALTFLNTNTAIIAKVIRQPTVIKSANKPVTSPILRAEATVIAQNKPVLIAPAPKSIIAQQPVVDTANNLIAVQVIPQTEKPTALTTNSLPAVKPATAPRVKRHRIESIGDMLNVVIAAVDKRKDKVVEFSNTDDDESSIIGLNLGIIKVKKQD